jgi:lysophospholipase L1-like esterase
MKNMILISMVLAITACGKFEATTQCTTPIPPPTGQPTVLVVGDSISFGYLPFLQAALPQYEVLHSPCNGQNSEYTRYYISSWAASRDRFAAITFNNGMWDIADWSYQTDEQYANNLAYIGSVLKAKTDHIAFVLTTDVPVNAVGRYNDRVLDKNNVARRVMAGLGIPVIDLYTVSTHIDQYHVDPVQKDDVHFIELGYQALSIPIIQALDSMLHIHQDNGGNHEE